MEQNSSNKKVVIPEIFLSKVFEQCNFFLDSDNKAWAEIIAMKRNVPIKGKYFKAWISTELRRMFKVVPNPNIINSIVEAVEADAIYRGEKRIFHPRITKVEDKIWYDIGGDSGKAVKIDKDGWKVVDDGLPLFRQTNNAVAQVIPSNEGGNVKLLLDFINIKDEREQVLFLVTLITCFIPEIEHPCMVFHGSKGAAKTTAIEMLKRIVDPSTGRPSTLPRNIDDFALQASKNYLLTYDNLTKITPTQSDLLCQVVTGGSITKRELYTDNELITTNFQGCVALNGIDLVATRADLLDRSVVFMLERIEEENRKSKQELEAKFKEVLPEILSGIFDVVSKAINIHGTISFRALPRMADFCKWGVSVTSALGYNMSEFQAAYRENICKNQKSAIENNLLAISICILMEKIQKGEEWQGLASDLYKKLELILMGENYRLNSTFPSAPNKLLAKINEVRSDLEGEGIHIEEKRNSSGKVVVITKK